MKLKYVKFTSKRKFGIELEMNESMPAIEISKIISNLDSRRIKVSSVYHQDYNNNFWHVKFDRSCSDVKNVGGWEVASYVASGANDIDLFGKVGKALKEGGCKLNVNCGYHIHLDVSDLSNNQIMNIVAQWCKSEKIISEMCPEHRRSNMYCKLLTKTFNLSKVSNKESLWSIVCPKDCSTLYRRLSLNLCNYVFPLPNRTTLELRLPDCTLLESDIKNWIRFFIQFIELNKNVDFKDLNSINLMQFLEILGLYKENPFLVLSKALHDLKSWIVKKINMNSSNENLKKEIKEYEKERPYLTKYRIC